MRYALFKEVVKRQRRKKHKASQGGAGTHGDEDGEEGSDEEEDGPLSEEEGPPERMAVPALPTAKAKAIDRATPGISQDPIWGVQQDQDVRMDVDPAASTVGGDPAGINPDRYVVYIHTRNGGTFLTSDRPASRLGLFRTRVARLWATNFQDDEQVFLADLVQAVNEGLDNTSLFSTAEATLACQAMTEANEVMLSENIVYKI